MAYIHKGFALAKIKSVHCVSAKKNSKIFIFVIA